MENKYSELIMLNLLYNVLSQAKQQNTDKKVNSIYVQQAIDYMKPLIQGEVYPYMVDGLPKHIKL